MSDLRLFVAVYPPPELASALVEGVASHHPPDGRDVPLEQVHLTLQFIGSTSVSMLPEIEESVARSVAGLRAFELRCTRYTTLPARGPARLVAAETDSPGVLLELKSRLARRLAHGARRRSHDRFLPHLTLRRFRAPQRIERWDVPVDLAPFSVGEVRLVKSRLTPSRAVHADVRVYVLDTESC